MYIDYNLSFRDHIPLVIKLNLDQLPSVENDINKIAPKLNWDSFDSIKLREFSLMSDIYLSNLCIPNAALECKNTNCTNKNHIDQIKQMYDKMCKSLTDASNSVFGVKEKRSFDIKPGFNEHVKELHDIARKRFAAWREANKPRDTNNYFFRE